MRVTSKVVVVLSEAVDPIIEPVPPNDSGGGCSMIGILVRLWRWLRGKNGIVWLLKKPVGVYVDVGVRPAFGLGFQVSADPGFLDVYLPWVTIGVVSEDGGEQIRIAEAYDRGEVVFMEQMEGDTPG